MNLFFYGLFMDEAVLAAKGIVPSEIRRGVLKGYALRIGARATLVRATGGRAHGLVMAVDEGEADALYAEESVADYVAEPVSVALEDGSEVEALCYNLPEERIAGINPDYAKALYALAARLGFPEDYLDQINEASNLSS